MSVITCFRLLIGGDFATDFPQVPRIDLPGGIFNYLYTTLRIFPTHSAGHLLLAKSFAQESFLK